ncbi:hypothetical protein RF11_01610 [Thelohanellus kitauei]|uniref:Uncharacterized protein n=1 Tax=Thelohanellus kitauei TaxID=669202 RepID=A0A0C2N8C9_THEKT|nr:hypothetical protein RF11_01610 [Thelohanellus kitauei]
MDVYKFRMSQIQTKDSKDDLIFSKLISATIEITRRALQAHSGEVIPTSYNVLSHFLIYLGVKKFKDWEYLSEINDGRISLVLTRNISHTAYLIFLKKINSYIPQNGYSDKM